MVVADAGAVEVKLKQSPRRDVDARPRWFLSHRELAAQPGHGFRVRVALALRAAPLRFPISCEKQPQLKAGRRAPAGVLPLFISATDAPLHLLARGERGAAV